MGLDPISWIAIVAVAGAGVSAYEGHKDRAEAADNYAAQAAEQRKAQGEQKALTFQQQSIERRAQIREERVKRAKIMQASENGGTASSSGEFGSIDSLATQLDSNLGINAGRAAAGNRIGGYMQNAADFGTAAQQASLSAQTADSMFQLSSSIFSAAGGFKAIPGMSTPKG